MALIICKSFDFYLINKYVFCPINEVPCQMEWIETLCVSIKDMREEFGANEWNTISLINIDFPVQVFVRISK